MATAFNRQLQAWCAQASMNQQAVRVFISANICGSDAAAKKEANRIVYAFNSMRQWARKKAQKHVGKEYMPDTPWEDLLCRTERVFGGWQVVFIPFDHEHVQKMYQVSVGDEEAVLDQHDGYALISHTGVALIEKREEFDPLNIPANIDIFKKD